MNKIVRKKEDIRRDTNRRRNVEDSRFNILDWQLSDCNHNINHPTQYVYLSVYEYAFVTNK